MTNDGNVPFDEQVDDEIADQYAEAKEAVVTAAIAYAMAWLGKDPQRIPHQTLIDAVVAFNKVSGK